VPAEVSGVGLVPTGRGRRVSCMTASIGADHEGMVGRRRRDESGEVFWVTLAVTIGALSGVVLFVVVR
jgi:hypothetical protein